MMHSNYVVWRYQDAPRACVLQAITGAPSKPALMYGRTQVAEFGTKAAFRMDPDSPRDTVLLDAVHNISQLIVASPRLRALLEAERLVNVEFLPVTIYDHKKKVAAKDYVIVHPIDPVDCIDTDKSKIEWDEFEDGYIEKVKLLHLDESKIPKDRALFRLLHRPEVIVAHRDLASKIASAGLTGVGFVEIDKFTAD